MPKPKLLIIGGGGHARACIDVIEQEGRYEIYGILDGALLDSGVRKVLGYDILGGDEDLKRIFQDVQSAFIALGQIQSAAKRVNLYKTLRKTGYNLPSIISPLAYVARSATIQEGSIVMHHALINANATIGRACIINSKALIEHDCVVEDFCHISTASVINGNCTIGQESFLGTNMLLAHNTCIPSHSVLYHNTLEDLNAIASMYAVHSNNYRGGGVKLSNALIDCIRALFALSYITKNFAKFYPITHQKIPILHKIPNTQNPVFDTPSTLCRPPDKLSTKYQWLFLLCGFCACFFMALAYTPKLF